MKAANSDNLHEEDWLQVIYNILIVRSLYIKRRGLTKAGKSDILLENQVL